MEDVLETYSKPYDSQVPVLCMDEQPVQLIKDVKPPIALPRNMPSALTMNTSVGAVAKTYSCLPSPSQAGVRWPTRKQTKVDWAIEMARC